MRLLMTTDTIGGVWTYSTELVQGLLQHGASVALVTLGNPPSPDQTRWLHATETDWRSSFTYQVVEAPLEWMDNNERAYLDAESVMLRVAASFDPDLLHSNQFCFGALPLPIQKLVVAHSDVLSWAATLGHPLEPSPWLERYCALTNAGLQGADVVVAPSQWMLGALAVGFKIPCKTYVVPNGRTLTPIGPRPKRSLQAVTSGRLWDEAKNLKLLEDAVLPFPLMVAGEREYQAHHAPPLPLGAIALGPLSQQDLMALFQQSAIYICTSRYEPFGLSPLEAALSGCAVLANDIPSLREVWGSGALYFGSAAELSLLLRELAAQPEQLVAAQDRSWRRAQKYTGRHMTEQYLSIYQGMLARHEVPAYGA